MNQRVRSRLYAAFLVAIVGGVLAGGMYSLASGRYISLYRQDADQKASKAR